MLLSKRSLACNKLGRRWEGRLQLYATVFRTNYGRYALYYIYTVGLGILQKISNMKGKGDVAASDRVTLFRRLLADQLCALTTHPKMLHYWAKWQYCGQTHNTVPAAAAVAANGPHLCYINP